jgi:hypothetical protein
MNLLPKLDTVEIPTRKLTEYSLNPDKEPNKARAFKLALGYTLENFELLAEQIKKNLPLFEAVPKGDAGHGMKYEVVMNILGENGKTARVLTAWIDDSITNKMRLTNVYIDRRKKR